MCYPKPGPRCSAHAEEKMNKCFENLKKSRTPDNIRAYSEAKEEFYTTPKGIKFLEETNPRVAQHYKNIRADELREYMAIADAPQLLFTIRSEATPPNPEKTPHKSEIVPMYKETSDTGQETIWFNGDEKTGPDVNYWYGYRVAPSNVETSVQCKRCDEFFSAEALAGWNGVKCKCDKCGETSYFYENEGSGFDTNLYIREQTLECTDKSKVRDRKWYHVSAMPNLDKKQEADKTIYCGTDIAATMRATNLAKIEELYVYELTIKEDSPIDDYIYHDDNGFDDPYAPELHRKHTDIDPDTIGRYVNWYEDPGSMSLFGPAKCFDIKRIV